MVKTPLNESILVFDIRNLSRLTVSIVCSLTSKDFRLFILPVSVNRGIRNGVTRVVVMLSYCFPHLNKNERRG